jgi:predicted transcriptional regulator
MPVVAGSLVIIIGILAVASVETTRYSLLAFLAPAFTKIAKDKVLDHKTRYGIQGLIVENPGVHYSAIIREYGLTNGVAAYHLSVLEREGYIRSIRDGMHRRFYTSTAKMPSTHNQTPEELRERALSIIHKRPGISQKEISEEMGVNRDTIGYHLRELVKNGDLQTSRDGKYVVYRTKR